MFSRWTRFLLATITTARTAARAFIPNCGSGNGINIIRMNNNGIGTTKQQPVSSMPTTATTIATTTATATATATATPCTAKSVMARTALEEHGDKGEFKRQDAVWRNWIEADNPAAKFPAQSGRYHLYVAYACPWAHRTLMVRALKGLQDCIGITVVHPTWQRTRPGDDTDQHAGWMFGTDATATANTATTWTNKDGNGGPFPSNMPGNTPDPYDAHARSIRDVYERVGDTEGKYTVPILYDSHQHTIVSNESSEIIRMLNAQFNAHATNPNLDLYPEHLREQIDRVNDWIYPNINNGVYRCGFAKTQAAYDAAIAELTEAFDRVDAILQKQRYIADAKHFTEADVRLFVTLLRFDEVYTVYFKTNTRSVATTPALLNYCRDIYQMADFAVQDTVNMEQIKMHYYTSHPILNHYSIIPRGSDFMELLKQPHNRHDL